MDEVRRLLEAAEAAGARAAAETRARSAELAAEAGEAEGRPARRRARETDEAARRAGRRARTDALDLGLGLLAAFLRDLAAVGEGAEAAVLNVDELGTVRDVARDRDPRLARRAAEVVMDTRRRLTVHVGEELALEALMFRLHSLLGR